MPLAEIIGYCGSVLVAVSLMMSNLKLLRLINLIGALLFSAYGFMMGAIPVFLLNAFIAIADIYYLYKLSNKMEHFSYVEISGSSDPLLQQFLSFYDKDIKKYFPDFGKEVLKNPSFFFILRDMMPAGLFVYETTPDGKIYIKLDYVIPQYRDLKNSYFLFAERSKLLKRQGFNEFITKSFVPEHISYLQKIGFEETPGNPHTFRKEL